MATFTVTNLNDSGAGSLRQALANAQGSAGADTVTFAAGLAGGTLRLTSGELVIAAGEVTINGDLDNDGMADITVSGDANNNGVADAGDSALMLVQGSSTVGIDGLVLANGVSFGASELFEAHNAAGAIENFGTLTIENSILRDNLARGGNGPETRLDGEHGGDATGAIRNAGSLTIIDTAFENNRAEGGNGSNGGNGSGDFPVPQAYDGYAGGNGGVAAAGILNLTSGTLELAGVMFRNGAAEGGNGGDGGDGATAFNFDPGGNGGDGGVGGDASSGIINNGTISGDMVAYLGGSLLGGLGGAGGSGGAGLGGPYYEYGAPGADGTPGVTAIALLNSGSGSPEVTIFGTALADTFTGTAGVDRFFGLGGADSIAGLAGNDTLAGGDGDDAIDGGSGNDAMAGGGGDDGYVVDSVDDSVTELRNGGYDTVNTALLSHALGPNVERVNYTGSGDFAGTGNARDNSLQSGGGDDTLSGSGGNDTLAGGDGNDALDGGSGNDAMTGGGGNDAYVVDSTGDNVTELLDNGYDTVNTTLLSYALGPNVERVNYTGSGNFIGLGNGLNNRFQSGAGNDRFVADAGADIYSGGAGVDTLDYRASATGAILDFITKVHGGVAAGDRFAAIEKFLGSNTAGDTMTAGGTGRFVFAGYGGNDTLLGGVKNDQVLGGAGDDTLSGGADGDALDGSTGDDTMTGGTGADDFVYVDAAFGQDIITDFEDGLDAFNVFSAVADSLSDFSIAGNGTSHVVLTLLAAPANTITLDGAAAITITAADFMFY